jgi:predicted metal-dependent phosphoesterase TrpH
MMLKVEFHCHTIASKDCLTSIPDLIQTARAKGIDRLVVTDHNTIRGALEAGEIAPELIIVGEEILTDRGEILAAFVTELIPGKLPFMEAIERLKKQGAFISLSHPYDYQRHGWKPDELIAVLPYVDAIEVFNARCLRSQTNQKALVFAQQHGLAGTVGSDAHTPGEVGAALLELPEFTDAEGLRNVIRLGKQLNHYSSPLVHLSSAFAKWVHPKTAKKAE